MELLQWFELLGLLEVGGGHEAAVFRNQRLDAVGFAAKTGAHPIQARQSLPATD